MCAGHTHTPHHLPFTLLCVYMFNQFHSSSFSPSSSSTIDRWFGWWRGGGGGAQCAELFLMFCLRAQQIDRASNLFAKIKCRIAVKWIKCDLMRFFFFLYFSMMRRFYNALHVYAYIKTLWTRRRSCYTRIYRRAVVDDDDVFNAYWDVLPLIYRFFFRIGIKSLRKKKYIYLNTSRCKI